MGFVNEYASEEDISKYKIKDLLNAFVPKHKTYDMNNKPPQITIDHTENIFLTVIGRGTRESGNLVRFLLYVRGKEIVANLWLNGESSKKFSDDPYFVIWDIGKIEMPERIDLTREEIITILKTALQTYGYAGARRQIDNTIVKFNF